ncbi:MAG TPA: tRNA (adenosine(37)-N6)-threonylcarbamoyltransferase complex transferase subunit TsaD [Terriglobia bacterium]|nr:tRNA (adenosine(37)-N6)-threonylcarbamoyltransferase complex transferase subunit TsaD [Terriglobia bacterium]
MLVLGIESSCDETAAAIVENGERILSTVVASQVMTHEKYGGVVPEIASREHLRKIAPVVEEACRRAEVRLDQIDAIAVTQGPGLIGSLLVGLVYGKTLALALGKPLIGVNHLEGHIHSAWLENKLARRAGLTVEEAVFPNVTLVVSGGHTSLFYVHTKECPATTTPSFSYRRLGQTRDDAAGEAYDKVAKLLALGYPGGPVIDKLARHGNPSAVRFGPIRMKGNPYDFSFSGLKTAVLYRVRGGELAAEAERRREWCKSAGCVATEQILAQCSQATLDLVASFQKAVLADLVERTLQAAQNERVSSIFVTGGVACNSLLRVRFNEAAKAARLGVFFPSPALSTDNAAMIAAAGYFRLAAGERADVSLTAHASFPLGVSAAP